MNMKAEVMPVDMKVLMNHIYEYKKGVRHMVLYTFDTRSLQSVVWNVRA